MPFSSRKTKAVASNVSRTISSSASRLNPFARLQIDHQTEDTPTSNPFQGLEEVHPVETQSKPLVDDPKSKIDALKERMGSFGLDVVDEDYDSTHHNQNEEPEATTEGLCETADKNSGWEEVPKKNKRNQTTLAARSIVEAARSGVESSHWRTGKGTTNVFGWNAPGRHQIGTRFTGRRTRYGAANIFFGIGVAELSEGVILWHMETRECYDEPAEGDIFHSQDGQKHFRKGRFSVVASVHTHSLHRLSMFTYNGKGILEKKSEELKKEHIGIRPPHIEPDRYIQQNEYAPLEIESMNNHSEQLHERSVVQFTERNTLSFDTKIRVVGRLTAESIARLRKLRAQFGC